MKTLSTILTSHCSPCRLPRAQKTRTAQHDKKGMGEMKCMQGMKCMNEAQRYERHEGPWTACTT